MFKVYQVKDGDTIESIARAFKTTPDYVKKINGIADNMMLNPGGFIIIPIEEETQFDTYVVEKGDNMYEIARENGIDYNMLLKLNGLKAADYIYPNQKIIIPKKGVILYETENGDTLSELLDKLNISYETLKSQNKSIYLEPGQIVFYR